MKISPEYEKLHALWEKALFGSFFDHAAEI